MRIVSAIRKLWRNAYLIHFYSETIHPKRFPFLVEKQLTMRSSRRNAWMTSGKQWRVSKFESATTPSSGNTTYKITPIACSTKYFVPNQCCNLLTWNMTVFSNNVPPRCRNCWYSGSWSLNFMLEMCCEMYFGQLFEVVGILPEKREADNICNHASNLESHPNNLSPEKSCLFPLS